MNIKEKKNLDEDAFWDTMVDFVCAPVLNAYSLTYDHIEEIYMDKTSLSQKYKAPLYQVIQLWDLNLNESVFEQIYLAKQCHTVEQFMKTFKIRSMDQLAACCRLSFRKSIHSIKTKEVFNEVKKDLIFGFVFGNALIRYFRAIFKSEIEEEKRSKKQ